MQTQITPLIFFWRMPTAIANIFTWASDTHFLYSCYLVITGDNYWCSSYNVNILLVIVTCNYFYDKYSILTVL